MKLLLSLLLSGYMYSTLIHSLLMTVATCIAIYFLNALFKKQEESFPRILGGKVVLKTDRGLRITSIVFLIAGLTVTAVVILLVALAGAGIIVYWNPWEFTLSTVPHPLMCLASLCYFAGFLFIAIAKTRRHKPSAILSREIAFILVICMIYLAFASSLDNEPFIHGLSNSDSQPALLYRIVGNTEDGDAYYGFYYQISPNVWKRIDYLRLDADTCYRMTIEQEGNTVVITDPNQDAPLLTYEYEQ